MLAEIGNPHDSPSISDVTLIWQDRRELGAVTGAKSSMVVFHVALGGSAATQAGST